MDSGEPVRAWALAIGQREGGWEAGAYRKLRIRVLSCPVLVVKKVIGSSWFLSNNFGWIISGEGEKVIWLDLSSSEG